MSGMRIAVVAPSPTPFVFGGAERSWFGLVRAINETTNHSADLVKIPVDERTLPGIVRAYQAFARLDVSHFDMVVTSKYPAWMVRHDNHVVYMFHRLRGLYDTYPHDLPQFEARPEPALSVLQRALQGVPTLPAAFEVFELFWEAVAALGADHDAFRLPGPLARQLVHFLDDVAMRPPAVRKHAAISKTVARRPDYFPAGVTVETAYLPSDLKRVHCGRHDYFFTASRLDAAKRVELLAQAIRLVPRGIPLRIAGDGPDLERLRAYADEEPRIELLGRVSESRLADLYADALAVPFVPFDEDLGLITLEAMASGKPVITTHDSGGVAELVAHGETGLVVDPDPRSLAAAMSALAGDPVRARAMGRAGMLRAAEVTWDGVLDVVLSRTPAAPRRLTEPALQWTNLNEPTRHVVLSSFPVHPRMGGGQLRSYHLHVAPDPGVVTRFVSLTGPNELIHDERLENGAYETIVPKSPQHEELEQQLLARAGVPVTDIGAAMLIEHTPDYLTLLADAAKDASVALLSLPYMYPALKRVAPELPIVFDTVDVALELKRAILPDNEDGERLLEVVRSVEGAALRDAAVVITCTATDADDLQRLYGVPAERFVVIPNGVDTSAIPFTGWAERIAARDAWLARYSELSELSGLRHLAVFMGSLHVPNIDAARHIVELAPSCPDVLFALVGKHSDEFWGWSLPGNVALLGMVSEEAKNSLLQSADVALNPMSSGSGTNVKIVEYMAAGVPVLSTPLGARGFDDEAAEGILRVAPLGRFGAEITALLDDPATPQRAARARQVVEQNYDWKLLNDRLWQAVAAALPPGRAGH